MSVSVGSFPYPVYTVLPFSRKTRVKFFQSSLLPRTHILYLHAFWTLESVCMHTRTENCWTDFCDIWHWEIQEKCTHTHTHTHTHTVCM